MKNDTLENQALIAHGQVFQDVTNVVADCGCNGIQYRGFQYSPQYLLFIDIGLEHTDDDKPDCGQDR